jgi:hypothetical protein
MSVHDGNDVVVLGWAPTGNEVLASGDGWSIEIERGPEPPIEALDEGVLASLSSRLVGLETELQELAVAEDADRPAMFERVVIAAGRLIVGARLGYDDALRELVQVGVEIGMAPADIEAAIRSGFTAGAMRSQVGAS